MGRFLLPTGSMRDYFGKEGAVLCLDCGDGYKTLYICQNSQIYAQKYQLILYHVHCLVIEDI